MMRLAVVSTGTLFSRVQVREDGDGLRIGQDVLDLLGVRAGDCIEVHTDGTMLVLKPVEETREAGAARRRPPSESPIRDT